MAALTQVGEARVVPRRSRVEDGRDDRGTIGRRRMTPPCHAAPPWVTERR
jgi:hypothetical protein